MKSKTKIGLLSALFSGLLFTACESYPDYNDYVEEQLISVSNYDTNTNFTLYKTYSISDTVAIVNDGDIVKVEIGDSRYPQLQKIADQIKSNMNAAGYSYSAGKNSDLGIMISLVKSTNAYISYPWWWWEYCSWYYWDCGYFPYYPYPYPIIVGSYSVGFTAMDMFDLKTKIKINDTDLPAVWTGVVRGLYTGTHSDADITRAIDQCFKQTVPFQK